MAALLNTGVVPETLRLERRETHGDLTKVLHAAADEHEAGRLHNAFAAYREALGQWLRLNWIERSGSVNTTVTDGRSFLNKLRAGNHLDRWSFAAIEHALCLPKGEVSFRTVDIMAGIVTALCSDRVVSSANEDKPREPERETPQGNSTPTAALVEAMSWL